MLKALFEFGEVVEHEPCLAQPELWHGLPQPQTSLPVYDATPSFLAKEASAYDVDWYALELDRAESVKAHVLWSLVDMGEVNGI